MAAVYPGGIKTWTDVADGTDDILDHHVNDLYAEVIAIETDLLASTGWIPAGETWTYASASTITVASGAASRYQKGDKIKWTQTGVRYGYIIAVADTLLTIAVNTDHVVANAAISANYVSRMPSPIGFPAYFNYTPTIQPQNGAYTTITAAMVYSIANGKAHCDITVSVSNKGTATGYMRIITPLTASFAGAGQGQEVAATGYMCQTSITATSPNIIAALYNYATLWVNGYNNTLSISYYI